MYLVHHGEPLAEVLVVAELLGELEKQRLKRVLGVALPLVYDDQGHFSTFERLCAYICDCARKCSHPPVLVILAFQPWT